MNVLVMGATGYVGRRLVVRLLEEEGVNLRLLVRDSRMLPGALGGRAEIVEGGPHDPGTLGKALRDVQVAYYMPQFLGADRPNDDTDRIAAARFREACAEAGVSMIVYLSVFWAKSDRAVFARRMVEIGNVLSSDPGRIPVLWLRSGVIIGSGSAVFEFLAHLVRKVPLMILPRWATVRLTPIGMVSLLQYLAAASRAEIRDNVVADIGAEPMSLRDMLSGIAEAMGLRRPMVGIPLALPRLTAFLVMLLTPFSFRLAYRLIDSLEAMRGGRDDLFPDAARRLFPAVDPESFVEALRKAIAEMQRDQVLSRWVDIFEYEFTPLEELAHARYRDVRVAPLGDVPPFKVFRAIMSIGGSRGWFAFDVLWRIRGVLDKLTGGYGTALGRRDESDLRVGDFLDVWKVVDIRENERLLLESLMKPGKGWIEFRIEGDSLVQTASYSPRGALGTIYWWMMVPFHLFIFSDMIKKIMERAKTID